MFDAFGSNEQVGQFLHLPRFTFEDDDLEATVMVEMGMGGAHDEVVILVLQIRQFFRQKPGMVIVDERDGPYYWSAGIIDSFRHQPVAY